MLTSPSPRAVRKISDYPVLAEQRRPIAFPNRPPERSAERLTLRHAWRPWKSFRLGRVFSTLGVCLRRKSRIAARIAGPVIILCALPGFASAQTNATWVGATSDWNTTTNWNPSGPPTGTATFNPSTPTSITFSAPSVVQDLSFNAQGYTFDLGDQSLIITGSGIQASLPNVPTFNVTFPELAFTGSSTAGPAILNSTHTGPIVFLGTSNAGTATITAGIAGQNSISDPNGFTGGFIFFRGGSTAANATITTYWASNIEFQDSSKAGNAKITAPLIGGSIFFENASSADHATITMADGTGELSFAPAFFGARRHGHGWRCHHH